MRPPIRVTKAEGWELFKAWLAITVAFTIVLLNPLSSKNFSFNIILRDVLTAIIAVSLGFLLHELGHKLMARKYGCEEEFKADNMMLLLALIMSIFGFVFAAPGAVQIKGYLNRVQQGLISLAGPLMNLVLALAFLPGMLLFRGDLGIIFLYGFLINSWLGLFNMIPVGPFDGAKIYKWNKVAYFIVAILLLAMTIFGMVVQ